MRQRRTRRSRPHPIPEFPDSPRLREAEFGGDLRKYGQMLVDIRKSSPHCRDRDMACAVLTPPVNLGDEIVQATSPTHLGVHTNGTGVASRFYSGVLNKPPRLVEGGS